MYFQVHEVYYNEAGRPDGMTLHPIHIGGDSLEDIEWTLDKIQESLKRPILWGDDRFPEEFKDKQIKTKTE